MMLALGGRKHAVLCKRLLRKCFYASLASRVLLLPLLTQRHHLCRNRAHVPPCAVQDEPDAEERAESALLASAMTMSDGALTAKQEEEASRAAKHLSLRRETVLQWLHQSTAAGGLIDIIGGVSSSVYWKVYCRQDNRRGCPKDRYVCVVSFMFFLTSQMSKTG